GLVPLKEQFGIGLLYLFGGWLLSGLLLSIRLYRLGWRAACQLAETRTGLVLVLYILVSSAHLAISIHDREPRFTYHVVPFLLLLSTAAWLEALLALTKSVVRPAWTTAAFAVLLLAYVSAQAGFDLRAMAS